MNILIVTAMFPPIQTGTSHYSIDVADALEQAGHSVSVVTLGDKSEDDLRKKYDIHRLSSILIPVRGLFKHFRISFFYPMNYIRIVRIARKNKADVIFLVNHYLDIAFLAIFTSVWLKVPLFCSVHTQILSISHVKDKIFNVIDRLICGGVIFPFCRNIICADKHIEEYLIDVHGKDIKEKTVLIPFSVKGNVSDFMSRNHDYEFHNQLIGIGALIEQRNYLSTVLVFSHLVKKFPSLKLKIIGHIYYSEAIRLAEELGIAQNISFEGELPHEIVMEHLQQSDIYFGVATGKYKGVGVAGLEAMLTGVPTVVNADSDTFGRPLLQHMKNCVFIYNNDPEMTATEIAVILTNKALREEIGRNGRELVATELSWTRIADLLSSLFASTIKQADNH